MANDNRNSRGRFANQLFRNVVGHYLAKKYNLKFFYGQEDDFKKIGINFFTNGQNFYENTIVFENEYTLDYYKYIVNEQFLFNNLKCNFNLTNLHCQHRESAQLVFDFINEETTKTNIMTVNPYASRYNNNNDVFIHVRLDDASKHCPDLEYFDKALQTISFENGYISSDSIDHELCQTLISKYNLKVIEKDPYSTVQFGSTCKNVILSGGTYSWMIGLLAFFSNIIFPVQKVRWYGDIYIFNTWKGIQS